MTRKSYGGTLAAHAPSLTVRSTAYLALPPFVALKGLSNQAASGTKRVADGASAMTLMAMSDIIAHSQQALGGLPRRSVHEADTSAALKAYSVASRANSRYASASDITSSMTVEADLAINARHVSSSHITVNQAETSSPEIPLLALSGYLTTGHAQSGHASTTALSTAIKGEQARATEVAGKHTDQISVRQDSGTRRSIVAFILDACLTIDGVSRGDETPASLSAAMAAKSDKDEAVPNFPPVIRRNVSGTNKGSRHLWTCYSHARRKALPTPPGMVPAYSWDANNQKEGHRAVYALGARHWVDLRSAV